MKLIVMVGGHSSDNPLYREARQTNLGVGLISREMHYTTFTCRTGKIAVHVGVAVVVECNGV